MAALNIYPKSLYKTRKGQLYIVINEALTLGADKFYDGVTIEGGEKLFPRKFVQNRIKEFIKKPTKLRPGGELWTGDRIDWDKFVDLAKKARDEVAKQEWGIGSVRLFNFVLYERLEKKEGPKIEKPREPTVEEVLERGKRVEKMEVTRRLKREKEEEAEELAELEDMSELEEFSPEDL